MFGRVTNLTLRGYHAFLRLVLHRDPPIDYHFVTDQIAVGAEIRTPKNMDKIAAAGITHIINMQEDVDDGILAEPYGIKVHNEPILDDYEPKAAVHFARVIEFSREALQDPHAKLLFHCYAGVHRGPLMALAALRAIGYNTREATFLIKSARRVADFPDVYLNSLDAYFKQAADRAAEGTRP